VHKWISSVIAVVLLGVLVHAALAQAPARSPDNEEKKPVQNPVVTVPTGPPPLSTRVVAYYIDAQLNPATHTIEGRETLVWKNLTGQPQQDFPFHMYMNAFQPTSTWISEARLSNPDFEWKPTNYGSIEITSINAGALGDLKPSMHFIQPDDNNHDDHSVMQIHLPVAVPPNDQVEFHIQFSDRLPEVVARTGYLRDFYMIGQWFPKVGVWWKGEWNCHQFHHDTEFFADFGTFHVRVTVPKDYVVGAGGDLVDETDNPNGTKSLHFFSADTHDFSWTASPSFRVVTDTWQGSAGPVKIRMLMSPDHASSDDRYLQALKGTLALFDKWYGPYPYDRITVVDPPHGGFQAGGMEYPTLITADTDRLIPRSTLLPEVVVDHEFGHQYWYGMVATNEFEEAWLDEGINSYTEVKTMDAMYGPNVSFVNSGFGTLSESEAQRMGYLGRPDYDPLTRFAWKFIDFPSYGAITYGKTATTLLTLEKLVGEDTMRRAVQTWFMRYRFTHPTGTDFLKTIEEVSGKDLQWYFDQSVSGTAILDYAVEDVRSDPVKWYEAKPPHDAGTMYHSYVVIHRIGDFVFPTDLEVKFENGEVVREQWDGHDRWIRYTYDKPAKILSAEIDPEHQVLLDRNFYNNSYVVKSDTRATNKIAVIYTFVSEVISQAYAWLT